MADINEAKRLVLAQYEQERNELDKVIFKIRKDLGLAEDAKNEVEGEAESKSSGNALQAIKPGDFFGMTQVQAAKAFLALSNRQPASLQEIGIALHRGKATDTLIEGDALRNLSSLLSRSDDFISVAKGRWGLSEWYPNKVKRVRKPKDATGEANGSVSDNATGEENPS